MKITEPGIIKDGEKDLIDAVKDDLDLDAVKQILEKKMTAAALSARGGEIIVHNNEIAFRLDFDIQLSGSLMFDRQGNYIPESDSTDLPDEPDEAHKSEENPEQDEGDSPEDNNEIDFDEDELNIGLPDYDFDDDIENELTQEKHTLDTREDSNINDITENENADIKTNDVDQLTEDLELDPAIEEDTDNDIDDILKESREFWEQKND